MQKQDKRALNIDGEEVDFLKDDLVEKLTFETANFIRRMLAYIIDLFLVIVIWYLCSNFLFDEIDKFMLTLGEMESDLINPILYEQLRDLVTRLILNLYLIWIGANGLYFTLLPAILGNGRSIGKFLAGIGVVDKETLEEISPSRLILREIISRCLLELLFIIPLVISIIIAFFRSDSSSLHDLIAKTTVIRLDLYEIESS